MRTRRMVARRGRAARTPWVVGFLVLASCRLGAPTRAPDGADHPRCFAPDSDGNQITCAAPERAYERDRCSCSDRYGRVFFGRVREHPQP
jgi:hypothetical protein